MEKDIAKKTENARPVDYAIRVSGVSKTFRIPHEKITSLRGAFVNAFSKNKGYEEFQALDDVSFEVKKGEFFGIIGRNGSGKSTLLKILAGIYQPDPVKSRPGKIVERGSNFTGQAAAPAKREFHGVKVNGLISPFLELGIGFNPELSGRDNVFLNASVLGLTHKQIEEKFDDIVEFSELRRFIDQKVKNYSSGMQVRLMFSVAIFANREILLMDEVLAVGDTNFQSKCLEEFNKYKDQGKTVILVTHDIGTVQRYCDRAMLLRNGKIEMIGDPEKVGNKYIYQNMSDEEKRIAEEESRRKKLDEELNAIKKEEKKDKMMTEGLFTQNRPSRRAIFEKIKLLNEDEKEIKSVEYNQGVILRMLVEVNSDIDNLAFGYHIRDLNGLDIIYSDSVIENFKFTNLKKGQKYTIEWKFKMALVQGNYKIACMLSVPVDLKKSLVDICDFVGSSVNFKVHPRENSFLYGKVHWSNSIKINNLKK